MPPAFFGVRCLVVVPTFNEASNLPAVVAGIREHLDCDILIVDDASPDGTGALAVSMGARDSRLHVLRRASKQGLGPAYRAGFAWALRRDYDRIIEMDCDLSHAPRDLPRLVEASLDADLVVGSRYVTGGETEGWGTHRRWISRAGNLYARSFLGYSVRDWTTGFRCYRRSLLERLDFGATAAGGFAFQIEMTWLARQAGATIREVPVRFVERARGASKMSLDILWEAVRAVPRLRFQRGPR